MSSPMEMTELYDNALLGILQHVGNIQNFLQVYFGFLYRKTDFYRLLSGPNDRMGFPPGVAEKMVLKTFRMFERIAAQDRERLTQEKEMRTAPPAVQEVVVQSEQQEAGALGQEDLAPVVESASPAAESASPTAEQDPPSESKPACSEAAQPPEAGQAEGGSDATDAASGQTQFQANPDSYNGAVRDNYSWSQDYSDVEVRVCVPANIVRGKQVSVDLQASSIRVAVWGGATERVLMEGEFTHKINTENSLWSLEPGSCVLLSLNKSGEVWWSAVLKGEAEIDINHINRERSMATVDEEEHAVLDRLTFDYHQKLQGKPQSHEMKVHEMLKKGWDAEGSPFKGQTFDPTMFDIPPSAVQF
ncbi:nudC domain-containing protein 3 [Brienomyrus brachyistius]|uniref:nudC domain-containing protein 3 n=1 Tax=Brienomyrus brachyistius TaxID=42636 RepID=UPI0020B218E0|nr:nudC domain-containing protein 3 [Brienomyrus brachyistius]